MRIRYARLIIPSLIAVLFFLSKKNISESLASDNKTANKREAVYTEHGILHVSDFDQLDSLCRIFDYQKRKLKGGIPKLFPGSFKSMYECFEEIAAAETAIADEEAKHPERVKDGVIKHPDLIKKHPHVTVMYFKDGSSYYEPNIDNYTLMPFVNEDGIIAIGNELRQYSKDTLKILKSTDIGKIDKLKKATTQDKEVQIIILTAAGPAATPYDAADIMKETQNDSINSLLYEKK